MNHDYLWALADEHFAEQEKQQQAYYDARYESATPIHDLIVAENRAAYEQQRQAETRAANRAAWRSTLRWLGYAALTLAAAIALFAVSVGKA